MLEQTPEKLWDEVRAAEDFRDSHLSKRKEMIHLYVGGAYRDDLGENWPENHMYEFIRLTTGRIIFDNPRVRVKTRKPGNQRLVAEAIGHALNRWVKDTDFRSFLKRMYVSQSFGYAVAQTVVEPQPWMDPRDPSVEHWPRTYELDVNRFFFDPLCRHFGEARFVGHKWVRDKDDLLEAAESKPNEGWDVGVIRNMPEDQGTDELDRDESRRQISRKEVIGYDIWVPEARMEDPEDGFHGTIFTIAVGGGSDAKNPSDFIRKPRAFYGPKEGPYTLFGSYPVPNDPFPLGPFPAVYGQMKELNEIVRASNQNIREYKRIIVCSTDNPDLARKMKETADNYVVAIPGFEKDKVQIIELGGITEQHLAQQAQAMDRLDRNTGISETERGNVNASATATAIATADAAGEASISYVKQEFTDSTQKVLKNAAWYLYHDDRIKVSMGEEAAAQSAQRLRKAAKYQPEMLAAIEQFETMKMAPLEEVLDPLFNGGGFNDGSGARFEDLELEIEPYSMERANEALMRAQYAEMMQLLVGAAPLMPQTPWIKWKMLLEKGGEVMNDTTMGDMLDDQLLAEVAGMPPEQMGQEQPYAELAGQGPGTKRVQNEGQARGDQLGALQRKVAV